MQKIIKENKSIQIIEKKSKFIADICYVRNIEEAEEKLKEIRKKYKDANHHCFAYRVRNKETILERASDDGEPKGTAGGPILNVINKQELINVLVVVTRYFRRNTIRNRWISKGLCTSNIRCNRTNRFHKGEINYKVGNTNRV